MSALWLNKNASYCQETQICPQKEDEYLIIVNETTMEYDFLSFMENHKMTMRVILKELEIYPLHVKIEILSPSMEDTIMSKCETVPLLYHQYFGHT